MKNSLGETSLRLIFAVARLQVRHVSILTFFLLVVLFSGSVFAEKFDLQVYASRFDSIPIGVLEFRNTGGESITENEPWNVVASDLDFTGRFEVVKTEKVDTARFREKNVGIFIDGEYVVKGGEVIMDCYLHDATTGDLLFGKKYRGELAHVRQMAHRYAGQLVEMLLGEKSPFQSRIVFVRNNGDKKNLFIMDFDGHNIRQLTKSSTVNVFPVFADSNTILWTGYYRGKPDIYKASTTTGKFSIFLYSRFVESSPAVSTVLDKVAYSSSREGNLDIYTCDIDGSNKRRISFAPSIDTSPCWSPNGYQIAFTSDRSGRPQIYVMDVDGGNCRRLTFEGRYQDSPAWSPKGDRIAYSSLHEGKFDIWTINPDGSEPTRVTSCPGTNQYPTWSPDASHIAFVSSRGGKTDIYQVRPDGTGLRRVTELGNAEMPDWSQF